MIFVKRASIRVGGQGIDYWGGSFYSNLLTSLRVQAWYLKQLVFPTPIAQYFGAFDISHSLADWRVLAAFVVVGGVIAAGLVLIGKKKLAAFAVLGYFAMLTPVAQIIPHHELLADHYLYLPILSLGLVAGLLAVELAEKGQRTRLIVYGACVVVIGAMAARTVIRNGDWKDEFALWQANYESVPESPRAAFNLGAQYLGRNNRKAEELFKRALELDATYAPTYAQLAQLYLTQNRLSECEELLASGLSLKDGDIRSFITREPRRFRSQLTTILAVVKARQGDEAAGERYLEEAIAFFPGNPEPYDMLATIYKKKGKSKEIEVLLGQVHHNPYVYDILKRLTLLLIEERRFDESVPHLEQMLRLAPNDFYANYQLGQVYRTRKECDRSRAYLEEAIQYADSEELKLANEALRRLERVCRGQE
jgi:tetratricopeptide (TPR) repeat protein